MKKNNKYLINGKAVPSVTTVLNIINKPELIEWYGRLGLAAANKKKEEAAEFGSIVHTALESVCNGQTPSFKDERVKTVVENFLAWEKRNIKRWITFEKAIFNDEHLYAGTIDAIAELKSGAIVLVDFKTSKRVWAEYYLQVAAYTNATRIEDNVFDLSKLEGAIILHLDHDSLTWEGLNVHLTNEFEIFLACLKVHLWKKTSG